MGEELISMYMRVISVLLFFDNTVLVSDPKEKLLDLVSEFE